MHTKISFTHKVFAVMLLALMLVSLFGGSRLAQAAGPLTSNACSSSAGVAVCNLWATTGSIMIPGSNTPITIWGYADTSSGAAVLPGPTLIVNQNDQVTINLTNNLGAATSLRFEGQGLRPDLTGAAANGGTQTYTFTASQPGVFLYEAGPLPGAQYQAAMGMSGALIVRSTIPGQAYTSAASVYTDEALVVMSEIDPVLNGSTNPADFDMRKFKPRFFLINGKVYPQTDLISVTAGSQLLLRYVNGGQQPHTMALLGLQQTFLSLAGAELPNYRTGASQLLMPGQSADAIAVVAPTASAGTKFALYEAGALLTNNGSQAFGGMLAFVEVGGTPPAPSDTLGPATSGLTLSPNPTNGSVDVTLTATISDAGRGDANVTGAEFFIDTVGANGSGTVLVGSFGQTTVNATGMISTAVMDLLLSGNHTLYVHGLDANGNWGSFNTIVLNLDTLGPQTSGIVQTPVISNGLVPVTIRATGSDAASGGSVVTGGDYLINGTVSGAMVVDGAPATTVSLVATLNATTMGSLGAGAHVLQVRSVDSFGNVGLWATTTLTVDNAGPVTSAVSTNPLATNGTSAVRVDALVADTDSKVTAAELYIDTAVAPGKGLGMMSKDGAFNELAEDVYQTLSQVQANALAAGPHTLYVRGKDAAGNWGTAATYILISDKVAPVASNPGFNPNPVNTLTGNNTSFNLTFSANGTGTNIVQAEWFEGADPGQGKGKQFAPFTFGSPVNLSTPINFVTLGMTPGNHTFNMRARDAANNWSNVVSVVVNIIYPNDIFANGFDSGNFAAWSATGGAAAQIDASSLAMAATISGGTSGYVQDNSPFQDSSYHARFYINPGSLAYTTNGVASTARTIFLGLSPTGGNVFTVQLHRTSTTGSFQVRAQVFRAGGGGGVSTTAWFTIPSNTYTAVEIDWASATSAAFTFYVRTASLQQQAFTGLNTSAFKLDTVRLGPQGSWTNVSGTMYFDTFASTRRTLIGP